MNSEDIRETSSTKNKLDQLCNTISCNSTGVQYFKTKDFPRSLIRISESLVLRRFMNPNCKIITPIMGKFHPYTLADVEKGKEKVRGLSLF